MRPVQQALTFRTWGGKRAGAGRKPSSKRPGVPHRARPEHAKAHPVHVTFRAARGLPSLRAIRVFRAIRAALPRAARSWFRILHFTVQHDHLHALVEADDKTSFSRGVTGLEVRLARVVNRVLGRRGKLWHDRYHARALRTPREVRLGLIYVLANWKKHIPGAKGLDPCSSASLFDGWKVPPAAGPPVSSIDGSVIRAPESWLARTGWKRYGLIEPNERPKGVR